MGASGRAGYFTRAAVAVHPAHRPRRAVCGTRCDPTSGMAPRDQNARNSSMQLCYLLEHPVRHVQSGRTLKLELKLRACRTYGLKHQLDSNLRPFKWFFRIRMVYLNFSRFDLSRQARTNGMYMLMHVYAHAVGRKERLHTTWFMASVPLLATTYLFSEATAGRADKQF